MGYSLKGINGSRFNTVKAYAQKLKGGECRITVEGETSRDKRLFERFSFCPEEGVVKRGELLTFTQEKRVLTVKVLWVNEKSDGLIVG